MSVGDVGYLTIEQAAVYLSMSVRTVRYYIQQRVIPCKRVGGRRLVPLTWLNRYRPAKAVAIDTPPPSSPRSKKPGIPQQEYDRDAILAAIDRGEDLGEVAWRYSTTVAHVVRLRTVAKDPE